MASVLRVSGASERHVVHNRDGGDGVDGAQGHRHRLSHMANASSRMKRILAFVREVHTLGLASPGMQSAL